MSARIIRRAIRHGRRLGAKRYLLLSTGRHLGWVMGDACPPNCAANNLLLNACSSKKKSNLFSTLDRGLSLLEENGVWDARWCPVSVVFKLYV